MADRRDRATLARQAASLNAQSRFAGLLPALALLTDDSRLPEPLPAVKALPRGSLVIVRTMERERRAALAEAIMAVGRERGLIVLIAADDCLAARLGADGVHVPQAGVPTLARLRRANRNWFLTAATHDLRAARQAGHGGADAVLVSPVFGTASHPGAPALGPAGFAAIARSLNIPAYALGGVDAQNARRLAGLGAAGIAAIGGLSV